MCAWNNIFLTRKLRKCLIFADWLTFFAVVLHRSRMRGPQVRLLSIVTPNTLWSLTSVICWLPTEWCADGAWSSCRFWRVVSIMYFVFDGLRGIWLRCVHSTTSERHDWRTDVIAGTSCPEVWIVVSSANMSHCAEGIRQRGIWLRCVHSTTSERHDWRTDVIAGTSCPEVWIVVSSANMSHCAEGIRQGRSFI